MNNSPSTNGSNGRTPGGKFGNDRRGRGIPQAPRVAVLRAALVDSVSEDDIRAIAAKLGASAKWGNIAAVKLLLAYLIGTPAPTEVLERIEYLEARVGEIVEAKNG